MSFFELRCSGTQLVPIIKLDSDIVVRIEIRQWTKNVVLNLKDNKKGEKEREEEWLERRNEM